MPICPDCESELVRIAGMVRCKCPEQPPLSRREHRSEAKRRRERDRARKRYGAYYTRLREDS